jgi:flagellar biosynthesis protein FliR
VALLVATVILGLRGATAVLVLTALAGVPRVVVLALAAGAGVWSALLVATGTNNGDVVTVLVGLPTGALAAAATREVAIGATLGLVAAVPLVAAAAAGAFVDHAARVHRGPYAPLFAMLAGAVFVGIDGHVMAIAAVVDSYRIAPQTGIAATAGALVPIAVRLATPWLVTAAVVQIAVGAANRVATRTAAFAPLPAAVPAALAMMTASLVGVFAVAVAAAIRG